MAYKLLGYVVWNGAKWYVKRRYLGAGGGGSKRRVAVLGVLGVVAAVLVARGAAAAREGSSPS
ncbi:MAG TPA: hypothetical protein VI318_09745 [Baekduia sp.]